MLQTLSRVPTESEQRASRVRLGTIRVSASLLAGLKVVVLMLARTLQFLDKTRLKSLSSLSSQRGVWGEGRDLTRQTLFSSIQEKHDREVNLEDRLVREARNRFTTDLSRGRDSDPNAYRLGVENTPQFRATPLQQASSGHFDTQPTASKRADLQSGTCLVGSQTDTPPREARGSCAPGSVWYTALTRWPT